MKFARGSGAPDAYANRVILAVAARDYASAVALWNGSSAEQRAEARNQLDLHCSGPYASGGVFAGALIESLPRPEEVASIRARLGTF